MGPLKLLRLDNDPVTLDLLQEQFRWKNDEILVCEQPSALGQLLFSERPARRGDSCPRMVGELPGNP